MRDSTLETGRSGGGRAVPEPTQVAPVPNATLPYWRTQLHWIDEHRSSSELPSDCDVAIIGTGMSGVATAYHLCEQAGPSPPSIVVLEARQVCSGATGRNGGHAKVRTTTILGFLKRAGPAVADEMAQFVNDQIYAIKRTVEKEGLDCEFELRRTFDVFLDTEEAENVAKEFKSSLQADHRWTREVDLIGKEFAEQITSMKGAKAAFSAPACSLWPYKFVSQLLARLVEKSLVNLQTNTPVTRITQDEAGRNLIHTSRGIITARKVVFATNGYTAGLCQQYAGTIVPVKGTASHISPTYGTISPHLSNTYNISYPSGPGHVDYLNPRPDGGIVVGGGNWTYAQNRSQWYGNCDDSTLIPGTQHYFDGLMQKHFTGWQNSGAKVDSIWTGIMGYTADENPHVGEIPGKEGRQYIIAGFNGGGMAQIFLCAKGLAKMVGEGMPYAETGVPRSFQATHERLVRQSEVSVRVRT